MEFQKYHALGNDYLVLDPAANGLSTPPEADAIVKICHRNFGLGSDGILYGPFETSEGDFGLRIYNPDGSEAEKSGNGLRIFSRYLVDSGKASEGAPCSVYTPGGLVQCLVRAADDIAVEMGRVSFDSAVIPVTGDPRQVLNEAIEVKGNTYRFFAATVGNPHCVLPLEEISRELACEIGPLLERHPYFPNRTNVQLLKVIDRSTIQIEIWERGAGYTLASGSSSSAAAAVARRMGACDGDITVKMPGGTIRIEIDDNYGIRMTGPATRVGTYTLDGEVLSQTLPAEA